MQRKIKLETKDIERKATAKYPIHTKSVLKLLNQLVLVSEHNEGLYKS